VVTATLACAVVLRALFSDGEEPSPPQLLISPTATQSPSAAPHPPLVASGAVLEKRVFAAGDPVTVTSGIGFLSAETGAIETWSPADASPSSFDAVLHTPDGALLVYYPPGDAPPPLIVERATGKTWQLAPGIHPLVGTGQALRIVVAVREGDRERAAVLNLADGSLQPFGDSRHYLDGAHGIASPDGRHVALHLGNAVSLLDLPSARLNTLATDIDPDEQSIQALPGALGFVVAPHDPGLPRRWYSWDGVEVDRSLPPGALSPNGTYLASQWSPGPIKASGAGGSPSLAAVTISERRSARPLAQYLGAEAASSGSFAWMANAESLVVQVPAGYLLVGRAGSTIASIPDEIHVLNPRPSPTISGLLGTSRGTIINAIRGTTVSPDYVKPPWRAEWTTRPGELAVRLNTPGKGRAWPVDVMPFEVRTSGISFEPAVAVQPPAACAEVRQKPSDAAPLVECAPAGVRGAVTVAPDPDPGANAGAGQPRLYAGIEISGAVWLHVSLVDGATGWVRGDALAWAR